MSYPHYDLVERAYHELIAEGKIMPRSTQEAVEADKALITFRAGWYTYQERSAAIGLLEKLDGNNHLGYSVDILIQTDGTYWDVTTDSAGSALPANGGPSTDTALIPRWRHPTAALAQVSTMPVPVPPSGATLDDVMTALHEVQTTLHQMQQQDASDVQTINAHTTMQADRVITRLNELRQEVIDFAELAGKVLLLKHRRDQRPDAPAVYVDIETDPSWR